MRGVVVTDPGVYHPKALVPRLVLYVICLAAIAVMALAGRLPLQSAGLYFALLALPFGWSCTPGASGASWGGPASWWPTASW